MFGRQPPVRLWLTPNSRPCAVRVGPRRVGPSDLWSPAAFISDPTRLKLGRTLAGAGDGFQCVAEVVGWRIGRGDGVGAGLDSDGAVAEDLQPSADSIMKGATSRSSADVVPPRWPSGTRSGEACSFLSLARRSARP